MKARLLPAPLRDFFAANGSLAIAFSGGLDSRFLCHAALLCGADVLAIAARGPHVTVAEIEAAGLWAKTRDMKLFILEYDPLQTPAAANDKNRCHACKKGLFVRIGEALAARGENWRVLCDGVNLDDLDEYRPGLRASGEAGIVSPLALAGLRKADIRRLAALTGMDNPDQRARPCLLTRFAYGVKPEREELQRLERAEARMAEILSVLPEPPDFRLRLTPEPLAQVGAPIGELGDAVLAAIEAEGFADVKLMISEKVSGYYDRAN